MTFNDIKTGVRDAWQFTWPPVLVLVLIVAIYILLAPSYCAALTRWLAWHPSGASFTDLQTLAKRYEFEKLLPLMSAFTIIFILFVTQHIVNVLGLLLPPTLAHRRDLLLARTSSDEYLMRLWQAYPSSSTLNQLANNVFDTVAHAKRPTARKAVDTWERKVANTAEAFGASKVLLLVTVIAFIAEIAYGGLSGGLLARFILAASLFAVSTLVFAAMHLYGLEQEWHARAVAMDLLMQQSTAPLPPRTTRPPSWDEIEAARQSTAWWSLHFVPVPYVRWVRKNLIPARRRVAA